MTVAMFSACSSLRARRCEKHDQLQHQVPDLWVIVRVNTLQQGLRGAIQIRIETNSLRRDKMLLHKKARVKKMPLILICLVSTDTSVTVFLNQKADLASDPNSKLASIHLWKGASLLLPC